MRLGVFAAVITVMVLFAGCVRRDQAAAKDESTGAGAGTPGGSSVTAADAGGSPLAVARDGDSGAAALLGDGRFTTIDSEATARAAVGTVVRVSGTAENAKLAGIVVHGDLTVYCLDRRFGWGDRARSHVTVEGLLELTDEFTARKQSDGTETAGTDTRVFVIRHCTLQ